MEGIGLMDDNKYYQRMINLRDCLHRNTTVIKIGEKAIVIQCDNCGLFITKKKSDFKMPLGPR